MGSGRQLAVALNIALKCGARVDLLASLGLERHALAARLIGRVYEIFGQEIGGPIHALSLTTLSP